MSNISDIIVAKETVSDDSYKVTGIFYKEANFIRKGDLIGSFETSKADVDIESPIDGYVFYNCILGDTISVGDVFACITEVDSLPKSYFESKKIKKNLPLISEKQNVPANVRISKPAEKLIEENKIDISVFGGLNIIDKKDVENYLNKSKTGSRILPEYGKIDFSTSKQNKVIIIGGGKHSKVCIDILRQMHSYEIAGIVYTRVKPETELMGYPILGSLDELKYIFENIATNAIIGVGGLDDSNERPSLFGELKKIGFYIPNIIHPRSIIEPSVSLGEGNQIMAGANIGSCSRIANNCIINSNTVISHDCIINDHVHVTPGTVLAGSVSVGPYTLIGMGVTVMYGTKIGTRVLINNGCNIFKNIPDNSIIK